jgi:hypothetical protein
MFEAFGKYKLSYGEKGQIFPFAIAVICVIIIFIMITVNLGQIGIFKTDVSNAADAAALAGVSVLSGTLLGLGLTSDMMWGRAIEVLIAIVIELCCFVPGWILAICTYIAFIVEAWSNLMKARGDAKMAWTNAKKTAIQYAFNNAGVDEPRPTFEEYLKDAYGVTDPKSLATSTIQTYYNEYFKVDASNAWNYSRSGFSKFMEDKTTGKGFWKDSFGKIDPSETSEIDIVNAYAWDDPDSASGEAGSNCYNNGDCESNYDAYDNWVKVHMIGSIMYMVDFYGFIQDLSACAIDYVNGNAGVPWWLFFLVLPIDWIILTFASFLLCSQYCQYVYPMGLRLANTNADDENTVEQVDNNPIWVEVTRKRRSKDYGLWNFRYGEIKAYAQAHAFRQNGYETIKPTICIDLFECEMYGDCGTFATQTHLFETELQYAY